MVGFHKYYKPTKNKIMTSERIKEIQGTTAYPESLSVYKALLQVWNECAQERSHTNEEVLKLFKSYQNKFPLHRGIQVLDSELNEWFEQVKKK